jgi:hypothetical protein
MDLKNKLLMGDVPFSTSLVKMVPTVSVLIMDASTSMLQFHDAPKSALNEFLIGLKYSPYADSISAGIVTFGDDAHVLVPVQPVTGIGQVDYEATGNTKLYGTVLGVLKALLEVVGLHPANIVVSVFSDGDDNRSPEVQPELIRMSARVRALGWNLQATGFGIDAKRLAQALGFLDDPDHAVSMAANEQSISSAVSRTTRLTISASMLKRNRPITVDHYTVPPSTPPSRPH